MQRKVANWRKRRERERERGRDVTRVAERSVNLNSSLIATELVSVRPNLCPAGVAGVLVCGSSCYCVVKKCIATINPTRNLCREAAQGLGPRSGPRCGVWGRSPQLAAAVAAASSFFSFLISSNVAWHKVGVEKTNVISCAVFIPWSSWSTASVHFQ